MEKQIETIKQNLEKIKSELNKIEGPIFIELIGTPKSGKTTLTNHIKNLFEKANIPFQTRRETAEYNPIQNKKIEEYEIWMIMELLKNLSEDMSNTNQRIVLYDRGMLDRIPWIDVGMAKSVISEKDASILKSFYNTNFLQKYKPITYNLITSPELSVERKGKPGRLVNVPNIELLNGFLQKESEFIASFSQKYTILQTDSYQGKLKEFIAHIVASITTDIVETIKVRKNEKEIKDSAESEIEK